MKAKRILSVLLAVVFMFSFMNISVMAGDTTSVATINNTNYATFDEAITAANKMAGDVKVEIYDAVEFTDGMELKGNYNSITFVSKDSDAKITINQTAGGDYLEAHGKTVNFTDLTLAKANPAWSGNSGHMGSYFSVQGGTVTYDNCIFPNGACTSGGTATYKNCTFQNTSEYGLWVYDDAIVTVQGGTVDSTKGIKVYSEDETTVTSTLTARNVTFTEKVTAKPAIAIGYAASVTLIGNTYNNKTGVLELDSGSDANCEGVAFVAKDADENDITSTLTAVDRSNSNAACGVFVTDADGNTSVYTTVTTAAKETKAGDTVTLLYTTTEEVELAEGVTLNKNGHVAANVTVVTPAGLKGSGTENDPYLIGNLDELKWFRDDVNNGNNYNNKYVELTADIDLQNEKWTPIGLDGDSMGFAGTLDGNDHIISNLYVDTRTTENDNAAGLFGSVRGTLKNFTVKNAKVYNLVTEDPTVDGTAAIAGCTGYGATIENVHVETALIESNRYVGGISGYASGNFINCTVKDITLNAVPNEVSAGKYDNGDKIGGIIGYVNSGATQITKCELKGYVSITGYRDIGGVAGCVNDKTVLSDNINSANITIIVDTTLCGERDEYNVGEFTGRGTSSAESTDNTRDENASYTTETITVATGTVTQAYTKEVDGYVRVWGEGGGNASESYELKLYSEETLIATTELNNVGGIIDGDVYVTWNFFYPESNDEYWTTTWEEGHPNSAAQPTKVVLYIDGQAVAENVVNMNAPDDLNPVVWRKLGGVAVADLAGSGSAEDPYLIENLDELKWFRDDVNNDNKYDKKYVKLTDNINLNNEEWTPIGNNEKNPFNGTFDGNGKTISNLKITGNNSNVGLFGHTNNGEIKNFTLKNADVTGYLNVGAVAGTPYTSKYTDITLTGLVNVTGFAYVGGVGGKNAYADWTNITVNVDANSLVKAISTENNNAYRTYVGGVIGFIGEGGHTFENITSNINVYGDVCDVGGITGIAHYGNKFINCSSSGNVTLENSKTDPDEAKTDAMQVGGIAGVWHNGGSDVTFEDCTYTGKIESSYLNENNERVTLTDFANGGLIGSAYTQTGNGEMVIDYAAFIGTTLYETLADAIAAAKDGDTIKLLTDISAGETWSSKIPAGVTIDGNGKTLTFDTVIHGGANAPFYSDGSYNVKNLKIKLTGNQTPNMPIAFDMKNGGTLTNVTVEGTFGYGAFVGNSDVTVNGCAFNNDADGEGADTLSYGVTADTNSTGKVTVINSTFNSPRAVLIYSTAKITGNTINSVKGISLATADATIENNTFNGARALSISNNINGSATITGNKFMGSTIEVAHQNSPVLSENYWSVGYETQIVPADGNATIGATVNSYYKDEALTDLVTIDVAEVNGVKYTTLYDAVAAADDGDTVTLLGDTTESDTITLTENVTIDLGSKTVTIPQIMINSDAKVEIMNGTIVGNNKNKDTIRSEGNSNLTLTNTNVSGLRHTVRIVSGNATINGGTYSYGGTEGVYNTLHVINIGDDGAPTTNIANVTINDGTFIAGKPYALDGSRAVHVQKGSTATINGGDFKNGLPKELLTADEGATLTVKGGTYDWDPKDYVATGYSAIKDLNGNYVVGTTPTATVNNLGKMTIAESDYIVLDGASSGDMPLNFVMQFLADQTEEDMKTSPYADWYGDFVITITGLENGNFTADEDTYLAGYYGDFGWVKVPIKDMVIEDGVRYPVMLGVGMGQKYDYICSSVSDFRCAMNISNDILEANPNLKVNLELSLVDNSKGESAAAEALISSTDIYKVESIEYTAEDFESTETTELFDIYGTNVTLGNSLAMNFYVKKSDLVGSDYYAVVRKEYADGRDDVIVNIPYSEWSIYTTDYMQIKFDDISAKEMSDNIYIQIFNSDGTVASNEYSESISVYAIRTYGDNSLVNTTLTDMLNYGAAAQLHFNYGVNELANSKLNDTQLSYATEQVNCENNVSVGKNFYGTNLTLKENIIMNMFFTNITRDMYAIVSYTDYRDREQTYRVEGSDFTTRNELMGVEINTLKVADGYQDVTCVIYDASGNEVGRGTDSIESYVARQLTTGEPVYEAIIKFVDSAKAYLLSR